MKHALASVRRWYVISSWTILCAAAAFPGGNWVRFEASPMKLTRELLEVMDSEQ